MATRSNQPLKGFQDRYPQDKALDEYVFSAARASARAFGFKQYDGPLVEPMELYLGKTSKELLEEQAFTLQDKNGTMLMLRPEMTPSLARMVAARSQELNTPARFFNIGLRYRYEAPQKGRDREFYQMDFDIIGAESPLADIEILRLIVDFFNRLGANQTHFTIAINSRQVLNTRLAELGIHTDVIPAVITCIDRRGKMDSHDWMQELMSVGLTKERVDNLVALLDNREEYRTSFEDILQLAQAYGIQDYITIRPDIVRGLDYYTGLVFEVIATSPDLKRSILGGGRYANLVEKYGGEPMSGIGCATSDTILKEFLALNNLLPHSLSLASDVLVTVFSYESQEASIQAAQACRSAGLSTELYPDIDKLQKQLRYAHREGIRFVLVIGPDEIEQGVVVVKDMTSATQQTLPLELAIAAMKS